MSRYAWTQEKIELLKQYYEEGLSNKEIAFKLNTTIYSVSGKAKSLKLKKNLTKVYNLLTLDEQNYITENSLKLSARQIAINLNRDKETIYKYIKQNNLVTKNSLFEHLMKNEEFVKDFKNPALTHSYVGRKYNTTDWVIRKWRLRELGDYKQMTDTYLCKSIPELEVEKILEELDLAYIYEKKILNWKVDYYLGQKTIIEVQGKYWHNLSKTKEKDERKFKELRDNGYVIIEIWENELSDKDKIKAKILSQFGSPLRSDS